jgi:putative flippase GtrA
MGKVREEVMKFTKAQASAIIATTVDFLLSLFAYEVCGINYVVSSFIGALSGGIINCVVNYRWVFGSDGQHKRYVALKYLIVWTGSIVLNTAGTYLLTELTGSYFIWSKAVVSVVVAFLWNYQMQRFFVYRNHHLTRHQ